jgi:predicted nucleic acid-binding protein
MIAAITRRERGTSLTPADANKARTDFRSDLSADYQVIELSESLAERAMDLAEKHGVRGFDAIQLAAVLEVNSLRIAGGLTAIILLSSDSELNAAASAEGVVVDDPNAHP